MKEAGGPRNKQTTNDDCSTSYLCYGLKYRKRSIARAGKTTVGSRVARTLQGKEED
jgi:hypothetical protein